MRAKIESDRSTGGEWLQVKLSSGERVDPARLSWLRSRTHRYLLEVEQPAVPLPRGLRYGVTGLESLRSFLRHYEITPLQYENILVSMGEVLGMLEREGQPASCLRFDEHLTFSDIDGNLWFLFLPLETPAAKGADGSASVALRHLARARRITFSSSDDFSRSRRLREALRTSDYALDAYESFLVEEYGIRLDFSDASEAVAGPLGGTARRVQPRDVPLTLPRSEWDSSVTSVATVGDGPSAAAVSPGAADAARDRNEEGHRTTAFRLVALDGSGGSFALGDCRDVLVGRGSACDVRIPNNLRISRTHARIEREDAGFRITDLGSSNGTFVRGGELGDGESASVALGETFELADVPMAIEEA